MTPSHDVTGVLEDLAAGNERAAAVLLPMVYDELRALADRYLRRESDARTLQPTALVHEVYLRLIGHEKLDCTSRAQFFAIAAQAMRRLLIEHARRRRAAKRGGGRKKLSLDEVTEPLTARDEYLIAMDEALGELALLDPQLSRVVELRFFGGLSVEETAQLMEISPVTVKRRWRLAKGWLHREILKGQ